MNLPIYDAFGFVVVIVPYSILPAVSENIILFTKLCFVSFKKILSQYVYFNFFIYPLQYFKIIFKTNIK